MKQIMLVEDTPAALEHLKEFLVLEDFEVTTAENGDDAMNKLYLYRPDLIITDLRMPKVDGLAFLQKVKKSENLKTIPVIVFTANATPENEIMCLKFGAVAFLKKPCPTALILETINKYLVT
jgi:CheY-like chemotaxis protein